MLCKPSSQTAGRLWNTRVYRGCAGRAHVDPPCLLLAPCLLSRHQLSWGRGLILAPLPWPLKPRDRRSFSLAPELCHPGSHRCLGWREPLAGQMPSMLRPDQDTQTDGWCFAKPTSAPHPHPAPLGSEDTRPFAQPSGGQDCWKLGISPCPGPSTHRRVARGCLQSLRWDPPHHKLIPMDLLEF